jgi:anti-sigma factor RsiW
MNNISAQDHSCQKVRDYLDSYLNNELLVETNLMVLGHLKTCTACSARLRDMQRVKSTLKAAVLTQPIPDGLQNRIHSKLHRKRPETYRWMLAAAAAVVIAVSSWATLRFWNQHQLTGGAPLEAAEVAAKNASVLQIGLADHVHCALDAGFANQSFSEEEMSQKLGPEYAGLVALIRDKAPGDLRVIVGHRCRAGSRQYIHLILRNQQTILSVVLTRKNGDSFAEPRQDQLPADAAAVALHEARIQNFELAGFEAGDFLAFVVSNLPRDDNVRIAASLGPALTTFLGKLRT